MSNNLKMLILVFFVVVLTEVVAFIQPPLLVGCLIFGLAGILLFLAIYFHLTTLDSQRKLVAIITFIIIIMYNVIKVISQM